MASLKHKIIKVKAEKIVFPGNVLCRCEDGIALFTEGLLPGEQAEVFVTRDKKSYREAKLEKILTPSPLRIKPKCPSFGKCGGCSFEHTEYKNQIQFKTDCVKELLNFTDIEIPQAKQSPVQWNYRNKMEFSFYNDNSSTLSLGLHCKGSFYKYSEVPPCYISHDDIIKACEIVKAFAINTGLKAYNNKSHEGFFRHLVLRKGVNTGDLLVNIVTNKQEDINKNFFDSVVKQLSSFCSSIYWTQNSKFSDAVNSEKITLLYGNENITETLTVADKKFNFSVAPFSFFQTNTKATEVLYNTVIELLQPDKQDTLLDMYCGTGAIGICLSPHVKSVVGVEQVEESIESAKHNAQINNINNIEFFAQPAQDWVKQNDKKFDCVIIDPPRAGLFENVIEHLLFLNPKKIVYVSCNPSTLARDLKLITKDEKYKVIKVCPVDMFPQTYHIETVVLLEKKIELLEQLMKNLIAYCGLDCEKCEARLATINNDNELRKQVAEKWSKLNNITITTEMINCEGCRIDGKKTVFCDKLCQIRQCAMNKKYETCGDCNEMKSCKKVAMVIGNNSDALKNLEK